MRKIEAAVLALVILFAAGLVFGAAAVDSAARQEMQKSSSIIGKKVQSSKGEDVGTIHDFVINFPSHTIAYALIDYENRLYPVPMTALNIEPNVGTAKLKMAKDKFILAPNFPSNSWPDLASMKTNSEIYSYYGLSPSWGGGKK